MDYEFWIPEAQTHIIVRKPRMKDVAPKRVKFWDITAAIAETLAKLSTGAIISLLWEIGQKREFQGQVFLNLCTSIKAL